MAPGNRKDPKRCGSSESSYSLMEFVRDFPNDEVCLNWLWRTRHALNDAGTRAHCPRCEEIREFKRYGTKQQRQSWTCTACGLHLHPTAGTIFHKSSTSLHLWFYAMYLMTSTRCGISAKQLERELGVTYKTAWRMFTLIRNELMGDEGITLKGEVEMDETWYGGKPRNKDRRAMAEMALQSGSRHSAAMRWADENKTPIFGMTERNNGKAGKVVARVVSNVKAETVGPHIAETIEVGTTIYTDEAKTYRGLRAQGWNHRTINHSEKVYVSGDVHTQKIEGFWALVKCGIEGTHHGVSVKWLQGYLNEYVWRYNHRDDEQAMFLTMLLRAALAR